VYLASSRVYALVGKTGLGHEHGVLGKLKSGRIVLGATHDAGELVFDMTSFVAETDTARKLVGLSGNTAASTASQVTANMLSAAVLNVVAYPTAAFQIDSAVEEPSSGAGKTYRLTGRFTLQKVTRPLSIVAEVTDRNGWNFVRGSFKLRQTDYGMKPYTKAFGAVGVADEMTVFGELWVAPGAGIAQQTTPGAVAR
jgi:hypothetical protein